MTDVVTIWNLALSAAGSRALVASPTEKGREADLCRLHYPLVRDTILKAASWPCANAYARLAVLATRDLNVAWTPADPAPNWLYAYAAPADMLAPRYSITYKRFEIGRRGDSAAVFSNEEQMVLHYTQLVENPALFDKGLFNAIVSALAARLCVPLSAKDNRAVRLREDAIEAVLLARTEFANESENVMDSLPSWIQVRGLSMPAVASRFMWPTEDFNAGFI